MPLRLSAVSSGLSLYRRGHQCLDSERLSGRSGHSTYGAQAPAVPGRKKRRRADFTHYTGKTMVGQRAFAARSCLPPHAPVDYAADNGVSAGSPPAST